MDPSLRLLRCDSFALEYSTKMIANGEPTRGILCIATEHLEGGSTEQKMGSRIERVLRYDGQAILAGAFNWNVLLHTSAEWGLSNLN